jgi:F-type H+-transporting ATPase subunit a
LLGQLSILAELEFPPVSHLVEWPDLFGEGPFAVNRLIIQMFVTVIIVFAFFMIASSQAKASLVPTGVRNMAESVVEFIEQGIIMQTIGKDGLGYTPFLLTLFTFIFVNNLWEIIPGVQMPVNARMALPLFLALLIWVIFVIVGFSKQGFKYLTGIMFPPGVPKALYLLVTPIELVSTFIVRPLSLSVRLFANMLAGHILLVAFAVITAALVAAGLWAVLGVATFALLVALTGFELLVGFLQAFIFTMLAGVYIGSSMHAEH